jgi:uncharacterized protein YbjT (DUF2867 family)
MEPRLRIGELARRMQVTPDLLRAWERHYGLLEHLMGRAGNGDFGAREQRAAHAFARVVKAEGVKRVVYLGGLGRRPESAHLRSRHETARILADDGPPLTYFRAAMVVGAGSESSRTLRYLVERLPVMVAPLVEGLRTETVVTDRSGAALFDADPQPLDVALRRALEEEEEEA